MDVPVIAPKKENGILKTEKMSLFVLFVLFSVLAAYSYRIYDLRKEWALFMLGRGIQRQ